MRPLPLALLALLVVTAFARSQDEPITGSHLESATARILGEIPDGTPPPPAPPKPEYRIASRDILSTAIHEQGGRTITIREIKPIALPPPPPPAPALTPEQEAAYREQIAEYREDHPKSDLLFIGATVFRSKDSPPRTLVRYWPGGKGGNITFWSSADFALIAGGINSFMDAAGDTHHLLMGWGNVDIERMAELHTAAGREYDVPELPDFAAGKATFQVIGELPDAENLVVVQSLHDLYNSEYERLRTAYEGRERARLDREEFLKANPPQPKDITLNFWRTEKPAAEGEGAAK